MIPFTFVFEQVWVALPSKTSNMRFFRRILHYMGLFDEKIRGGAYRIRTDDLFHAMETR